LPHTCNNAATATKDKTMSKMTVQMNLTALHQMDARNVKAAMFDAGFVYDSFVNGTDMTGWHAEEVKDLPMARLARFGVTAISIQINN
jgi:hypothetical protein